jgi:hypothetical protein
MAKKSRRARRSAPPARRIPRAPTGAVTKPSGNEVVEAGGPAIRPAGEPVRPRSASAGQPAVHADAQAEYPYVVQDLKRIAILAGTIFGALIALSFVLR